MDAGGVDAACSPRTRRGIRTQTSWPSRPRPAPRSVRDPRQLPARQARESCPGGYVEQRPGMLGCRFTFPPPHQSKWPTDGTIDWLWPAAERAGLPIALMAAKLPSEGRRGPRSGIRPQADPRSSRPTLRVTSPNERWANLQEVLAAREVPQRRDEGHWARRATPTRPYPYRDIHDKLRQLYDAFGPARWFWAPTSRACPAVAPVRDAVHRRAAVAPRRDLELVMGRAVCDWLGWRR